MSQTRRVGLRSDSIAFTGCRLLGAFIPPTLNSYFSNGRRCLTIAALQDMAETTSLSGILFSRQAGQSSNTWRHWPTASDSLVVNISSLLEIRRVSPSPEQIGVVTAENVNLSRSV